MYTEKHFESIPTEFPDEIDLSMLTDINYLKILLGLDKDEYIGDNITYTCTGMEVFK